MTHKGDTNSKKIGFWSASSLVIGNMIGSGVFLLPASLALFGGISLIGWIVASVGAIFLALVFGHLGRLAPKASGGPYVYTKISLGEFPAFLVAWGYWISIWSTNAAIAVALVGYLGVFFPILTESAPIAILTGLSFIWLISFVNTKGIRTVGLVQRVTTVLKVIPIFLVGCFGIFYLNTDHFVPFNLSGESNFSAIIATTTMTFFAFLGMESATIPSENMEQPERTISRATIFGTIVTIVIYILASTAIMGILPAEALSQSTAPFADAAAVFWGDAAKYIVAGGAVISTIGALNGWILIQGQIPMASAQDGLFPKIFQRKNKNGAPAIGILLSSILASGLMMLNFTDGLVSAFTFMMTLSTLSVVTPYLFSTASFVLLIYGKKEKNLNWKLFLATIAFSFSFFIIIGCGQEVVFYGFLLLMSGIPVYVWLNRNNN